MSMISILHAKSAVTVYVQLRAAKSLHTPSLPWCFVGK
jgi:hypothetical protein